MICKIVVLPCPSCGERPSTYYVGNLSCADIGLECKKCSIKAPAMPMFWQAAEVWNNEEFEFGQLEMAL